MKELLLILGGTGIIFMLCLVGTYFAEKYSCEERTISFEDSRYGLFSGCMVKYAGDWIPLDNLRIVE